MQFERYLWIVFVSNKRQAPTATSGANGRKACNGFNKTVPAMIAKGWIGRVLGEI